jgi:hypothetical protein
MRSSAFPKMGPHAGPSPPFLLPPSFFTVLRHTLRNTNPPSRIRRNSRTLRGTNPPSYFTWYKPSLTHRKEFTHEKEGKIAFENTQRGRRGICLKTISTFYASSSRSLLQPKPPEPRPCLLGMKQAIYRYIDTYMYART